MVQTSQELQQLRKEHSEIKPLAAAHPQLVEEVSACRAEVKAAEKRIASFDALAKKAATVFETRLTSIERERDQLLEQVKKDILISFIISLLLLCDKRM
jgi:outer membrane murein-binding lipoprotein Lpp